MRIDKRLAKAAAALIVLAAAAYSAWAFWGTDALLAVTFGTTLLATIGLGWRIVRLERTLVKTVSDVRRSLETAISAANESGEDNEQLLRAIQAGFARLDHTLDTHLRNKGTYDTRSG